MAVPVACPDASWFQRLRAGQLSPKEKALIEAHLKTCPACAKRARSADTQSQTGATSAAFSETAFADALLPPMPAPLPHLPGMEEAVTRNPTHRTAVETPLPPDCPKKVGRCTIRGVVGRAGLATVYRGFDADLGQWLTVKVLLAKNAKDADLRDSFLREARILSRLEHPGAASVHEIGALPDGRPFYSVRQLQGQTLAALLAQRTKPAENWTEHLHLLAQVCQTLACAHARSIIHCDLEPGNIVVGPFGEVQIQDWGLAQVLGEHATNVMGTAIQPVAPSAPSTEERQRSLPGVVMRALAYMAPEQAAGDSDRVDRRSDVFSLGAILCEILTGKPPYTAAASAERHRQAAEADLDDALVRLQQCGADGELTDLTRRCLSPRHEERPRHAGAVGEELAQYQAGLRQRLRQAEATRAAAQNQAVRERRRRRVSVALLTVALVAVTAAGAAALWYVHDQAAPLADRGGGPSDKTPPPVDNVAWRKLALKEAESALEDAARLRSQLSGDLADPLKTAVLLSHPEQRWKARLDAAQVAWRRAAALSESVKDDLDPKLKAKLANVAEGLRAAEADWALAKQLDEIRLEGWVDTKNAPAKAGRDYKAFFAKLGVEFGQDTPAQIKAKLSGHPLRWVLVAALDDWATHVPPADTATLGPILETARLLDPDAWRDKVRDPAAPNEAASPVNLAREASVENQVPSALILLAVKAGPEEGARFLREAALQQAQDFWLPFCLANLSKDTAEQRRYQKVALARRPNSAAALCTVGLILEAKSDADGALDAFRKAGAADTAYAKAFYRLGLALDKKDDQLGVIDAYRQAVAADPKHAKAWYGLGYAVYYLGDLEGAIVAYRKAIESDPKYTFAHNNLGVSLRDKDDFDGAIDAYQKAIESDPKYGLARANLGACLRVRGLVKESIESLELSEKELPTNQGIKNQLKTSKRHLELEKRLPEVLAGKDKPANPEAIEFAAFCLQPGRKQYTQALKLYQEVFAADKELEKKHRYDGACAALLLAAGKDKQGPVPPAEAAKLREQAKEWLRADLADTLSKSQTERRKTRDRLAHWKRDNDLVSVRDGAVKNLPAAEQEGWRQFWAEVDQTIQQLAVPAK